MELVQGETLDRIIESLVESGSSESREKMSSSVQMLVHGSILEPSSSAKPDTAASPPATVEMFDRSACLHVAELFAGVADGLQFAHRQGVCHRDLKPANLILDERGSIRILDFGLAWVEDLSDLTQPGDRVGTLPYMSPEQATRGGVTSPAMDIYSLGVTLYETLVWRRPFQGRHYDDTLHRIVHRKPGRCAA